MPDAASLKTLDKKLRDIHDDPNSTAFILADAKDADMAFGIACTGRGPDTPAGGFRSLEQFRQEIRNNVRQGLLDVMLMSVSTSYELTVRERLFDDSLMTPAIRANDTTDLHIARGSDYSRQPSRPFRTATIDDAQASGKGVDLGLYSVTFNNDVELDCQTLEAYRQFRIEADTKGFKHFLEVFDPNAPAHSVAPELLGGFINDMIVRCLAGVSRPSRPLFLKLVYHGPKFMEELVQYDRHLVPGVLGGSSGTTYDAFKLLTEARKYGARVALFGRKINSAEHQLTFVKYLRLLADGQIEPEEAVKAYHGELQTMGLTPHRPLNKDMELTTGIMSYGSTRTTSTPPQS